MRAQGVDRWITRQLEPLGIPDHAGDSIAARFASVSLPPVDAAAIYAAAPVLQRRLNDRRKLLTVPHDRLADSTIRAAVAIDSIAFDSANRRSQRLLADLQQAKVARALTSERRLLEVMTDFWENHFSVFSGKGPVRYMLLQYDRDVIRPHALGRFRDLLGAVAHSPAMLYYLDNWQNGAEPDRPTYTGVLAMRQAMLEHRRVIPPIQRGKAGHGLNENYARELLELHTLGVDGGYTQEDVVNVARAFTGWSIQDPERVGAFVFRPEVHDAGDKVVLRHKLLRGRGLEDGEEVLDIVSRHPATARFIATKLIQRFVCDTAPPLLVARVAKVFHDSDGNIREVMRSILSSEEFFSRAAYRAKVKSPAELVISGLRILGAAIDSTPRAVQAIGQLGEPLFGHLTPDGYPETAEAWINTGSILNRINFGLVLANGRFPGVNLSQWLNDAGIRPAMGASDPVDAILDAVLGGEASRETREILKNGFNPLAAAVPAGGAPAHPDAAGLARLMRMVGLALGSPEFQRR